MKKLIFISLQLLILYLPISTFAQTIISSLDEVIIRAGGASGGLTKVSPPTDFTNNPNEKKAFISVTYDTGFDNFPQAKAAFQHAVDILSTQIYSTVLIEVEAQFTPLNDTNVLGNSRPLNYAMNFNDQPIPYYYENTYYPIALANKIINYDLTPNVKDMLLRFNSQNNKFYFGTDGNTPAGKYDFVTLVLHELIHGIGFFSPMKVQNGIGYFGFNDNNPIIYDRFTQNNNGQFTTNFTNATTALGNYLQSSNLYFNGFEASRYNNYANPKIYAPNIWKQGSSYAHWDEAYFPKGNSNSLMTPILNYSESIHNPGDVTKGLLKDFGWDVLITTGVNDYIAIQNGVNVLTQGQNFQYTANFYDQEPYSIPVYWEWSIELLHESGRYTQKYHSINQANIINTWSFNLGYLLSGFNWLRDTQGNVIGLLKLKCIDSDGYTHYKEKQIGVKCIPDQPILNLTSVGNSTLSFSFFSNGATSYKIYYDFDAGYPYNGVDATQGSSGLIFNPTNITSYTLNGLNNNSYYHISITGVNLAGESVYSNEIIEKPGIIINGGGTTANTNKNQQARKTNNNVLENKIYPNPATEKIYIKAEMAFELNIYNEFGKLVKLVSNAELEEKNYEVDIYDLPEGIYFLVTKDLKKQETFLEKLSIIR